MNDAEVKAMWLARKGSAKNDAERAVAKAKKAKKPKQLSKAQKLARRAGPLRLRRAPYAGLAPGPWSAHGPREPP